MGTFAPGGQQQQQQYQAGAGGYAPAQQPGGGVIAQPTMVMPNAVYQCPPRYMRYVVFACVRVVVVNSNIKQVLCICVSFPNIMLASHGYHHAPTLFESKLNVLASTCVLYVPNWNMLDVVTQVYYHRYSLHSLIHHPCIAYNTHLRMLVLNGMIILIMQLYHQRYSGHSPDAIARALPARRCYPPARCTHQSDCTYISLFIS